MELTEASTGSRRRSDRKTEASKERCGSPPRNTSVTGVITARKASESSSTRTETNMKVCGPSIKDMAKERTGKMKAQSCDVNTQVTGMKIKSTEEAPFSIKMETDTTVTGSMDSRRVKVV